MSMAAGWRCERRRDAARGQDSRRQAGSAGLGGWTEPATDPADFVRRNTAIGRPPLVPEIALHLATEVTPIWQATEESLSRGAVPPPFWAFAWAGGQALARYVLDKPEVVRGREVLDIGSGSGHCRDRRGDGRRQAGRRGRDRPVRGRRDRAQRGAERGRDRGRDARPARSRRGRMGRRAGRRHLLRGADGVAAR